MEDRYNDLLARISVLEEKTDAVIEIINHLLEVIYEPSYIKKLDKLAKYGNRETIKQG
jgi:hypothetical protein